MIPGIDPKADDVFKRLFASEKTKAVLIDLLNAVAMLPVTRQVTQVTLQNPFTEKDYEAQKLSVLDIRTRDQVRRQFHLEMDRPAPGISPNALSIQSCISSLLKHQPVRKRRGGILQDQ